MSMTAPFVCELVGGPLDGAEIRRARASEQLTIASSFMPGRCHIYRRTHVDGTNVTYQYVALNPVGDASAPPA